MPFDLISEQDAIIHLSAITDVPFSITSPHITFERNVLDTLHILKALKKQRATMNYPQFLFFSTDSVYGQMTKSPVSENYPINPANPYAISKASAEMLIRMYAENYRINTWVFRCSMMIGERARPKGVVPIFIRQALKGLPLTIEGDGNTIKDINYVGNTTSAIISALEKSPSDLPSPYNVVNIGSGERTAIGDLAHIILSMTQSQSKIVNLPWRDGERGVNSLLDISKAKNMLRYKPRVSTATAINRTLDWIKSAES